MSSELYAKGIPFSALLAVCFATKACTTAEPCMPAYLQGQVQDSGQQNNLPVTPLTFQRVEQPLLEATAFRIMKPPGLQIAR